MEERVSSQLRECEQPMFLIFPTPNYFHLTHWFESYPVYIYYSIVHQIKGVEETFEILLMP
jgi:hypothetical protein